MLIFRDFEEIYMLAIIPEGASVIPKSQFFECRSLEKVYLPESVSVEDYAFADCHVLKVQGKHRKAFAEICRDISFRKLLCIGICKSSGFPDCDWRSCICGMRVC